MKLLSWGANTYGQLGHGVASEQLTLPSEIPSDKIPVDLNDIVSIAGGGGHTLLLDKQGNVYSCGWNTKGQLGYSQDSYALVFKRIQFPKSYRILKISCGWDSSMAATEDGILLAWGSNTYGQLGLPKTEVNFSAVPLEVPVTHVQNISMGLRHTATLTVDGRVWMCGDGRKGQLGLSEKSGIPLKETDKPTEIPKLVDVGSVSCGQHHTVALTHDGHFYVWGDNKHGQLGVPPTLYPRVCTPMLMNLFPSGPSQAKYFPHCGWTHTNVLTDEGKIINFGRNTYGQLGFHEFQRPVTCKPQIVPNLSDVKQLAVGSEHNIALLGSGQVYSWGWNEHGNCGVGSEEDIRIPTQVLIGLQYKTKLIGTGSGHSFAVVF